MQFATPFYSHSFVANSSQCNCIYIIIVNIEGYAVNDDIQYVADVWWQIGKDMYLQLL
jgi:hypothetical protein